MNLIVKAHNKFLKLKRIHPSELEDWVNSVHRVQDVLNYRVLVRDYPDNFSEDGWDKENN